MAVFEFDKLALEDILDKSIFVGVNMSQNFSLDYAPRDWDKPPKEISLKNGGKPQRNVLVRKNGKKNKHYYRKIVSKGGKYYVGVTGNLKRSIGIKKLGKAEYVIGVKVGPADKYAATHEFGDPSRNIPERSFLRRPLVENHKEILQQIGRTFKELSDKK